MAKKSFSNLRAIRPSDHQAEIERAARAFAGEDEPAATESTANAARQEAAAEPPLADATMSTSKVVPAKPSFARAGSRKPVEASDLVRLSVDIPTGVRRSLKMRAVAEGVHVRELVMQALVNAYPEIAE
jgi:hypothetical protein